MEHIGGRSLAGSLSSRDHKEKTMASSPKKWAKDKKNRVKNMDCPFGDFPRERDGSNVSSVRSKEEEGETKYYRNITAGSWDPNGPPKAGATGVRKGPPTIFRMAYDRGQLPIAVWHGTSANRIKWGKPLLDIDSQTLLPTFMDGVRERDDPYRFLATQGTFDLIQSQPLIPATILPNLIPPLQHALHTRHPQTICTVLEILQLLLKTDPEIGPPLVPYYRQLLPVLNIFKNHNVNIGDRIEFSQRERRNLGDMIEETLGALERAGGPGAYANIKYMIPTYESAVIPTR